MEKIDIMADGRPVLLPGQRLDLGSSKTSVPWRRRPTRGELLQLLQLAKTLIGAADVETALRAVADHLDEIQPNSVLLINNDASGDSCYYLDAPQGKTCLELNHQLCSRVRAVVGSVPDLVSPGPFALDGGGYVIVPFAAERDGGFLAVGWEQPPVLSVQRRAMLLLPLIAELAGVRLHSLLLQLHHEQERDEQYRALAAAQSRQVEALRVSERDKIAACELAERDELTGLQNRRGFLAKSEQCLLMARVQQLACAVIFADVDGLKRVNDQYGHAAGDELIRDAAYIFNSVFRHADVVGRVGGDEFAAFTFDNATPGAIIERINERIAQFNLSGKKRRALSLSVGVINCDPQGAETLGNYLLRADEEMYRHKRRGSAAGIPGPKA